MTSKWPILLEQALSIIEQAQARSLLPIDWSFGGGTALMIQIGHRVSHDIDLFITDPQILPYLNPATQDFTMRMVPDGYQTDGVRMTKLSFTGVGEIDFICSGMLTSPGARHSDVNGHVVRLETPEEIIAKKIHHRGTSMQPRDMFDIAATVRHLGQASLTQTLLPLADACSAALPVAERMDRSLARNIIDQLAVMEPFLDLRETAQDMTVALLRNVIAASSAGSSPAPG